MRKSIGILANLPADLEYLVDAALKYGAHQTDDQRYNFLKHASADDMEELASVAERYRLSEHHDLIGDFLDEYPITKHAESAKLYFLFGIMDEAGLRISPENWNSVERHIKALHRFGSFRLASERRNAALFLADFGEDALSAVPDLRQALHDEDLRVQVWAHYALAVIEGNRVEHEQAVREIYAPRDAKDELDCHIDEVGGEAAGVLEKFGEMPTR